MKRGTQRKLARAVGKAESFLSMVLSGERRVSWENAKLISEVTGSPVDIWMDQDIGKMREALSEWNPE